MVCNLISPDQTIFRAKNRQQSKQKEIKNSKSKRLVS